MNKEKTTKIITILIGLCIVFTRIILPSNVTITKNIVILEMFLEFLICTVVIILNQKDITKILKEKTKEKLWKYILKIIFLVFLVQIGRFIIMFIWMFIYYLITGTIVDITPAALEVENSFFKVAPIPLFICQQPCTKVQGLSLPLKAGLATKSRYLVILNVFSISSV